MLGLSSCRMEAEERFPSCLAISEGFAQSWTGTTASEKTAGSIIATAQQVFISPYTNFSYLTELEVQYVTA